MCSQFQLQNHFKMFFLSVKIVILFSKLKVFSLEPFFEHPKVNLWGNLFMERAEVVSSKRSLSIYSS